MQFIFLYLQYGVNVNYQSLAETISEFPAVTICNLNPVNIDGQNTTIKYVGDILEKNNIPPNISGSNGTGFYLVTQASSIMKAHIIADSSLTFEEREKIGFTMDTMLISCFFNDVECNSSDFVYFHSFEYGNCYTFNGMKSVSRFTSKSGLNSGLALEIFTGDPGE